jgi:RHS repeat-associated protein
LFAWIYLHQGGRFDNTSGLYYFRNRDYSPTLGRWMQQDPIGFAAGDSNLYRYVRNDSPNATDPRGLVKPLISDDGLKRSQVVTIITDDTAWGDASSLWWKYKGDHEAGISSPEALADYLDKFPDGSIKLLILSGHGSNGCGVRATKKSITADNMTDEVAYRIAKKLGFGADVLLLGCSSGTHKPGMEKLANKLQARVTGNTGEVDYGNDGHGEWVTVAATDPYYYGKFPKGEKTLELYKIRDKADPSYYGHKK